VCVGSRRVLEHDRHGVQESRYLFVLFGTGELERTVSVIFEVAQQTYVTRFMVGEIGTTDPGVEQWYCTYHGRDAGVRRPRVGGVLDDGGGVEQHGEIAQAALCIVGQSVDTGDVDREGRR
jgi:hypothetical protein